MVAGRFNVGCNYWASHAGTHMWTDWRPEEVSKDLDVLAGAGLEVLRVFPLWPDFQPIRRLYTAHGMYKDIRIDDHRPLMEDEAGSAGVSVEMVERFLSFLDMAQERGLDIVVGLITGWMSGRLYVPPALEGKNILTDPISLMWQTRFVRFFVTRFKDHGGIVAWDLGNECNCMARIDGHEAAWSWSALITNTIRSIDTTRPVISGMHSLSVDPKGPWSIADQADLTDMLTTHPYPIFTPHCDQDPVNTLRTSLHATAESRMYADVGGVPCMAEEIGCLGRMVCSEDVEADFVRSNLYSLWAHDCRAFIWWCAFDQHHLSHVPYDWHAAERDLGLFSPDRQPKQGIDEIGNFRKFIGELPFEKLPQRSIEAVCILTEGQDQWGVAYSSFVMAKQAGFDIEFQYCEQPLKDADLYLMPSIRSMHAITRHRWLNILDRVEEGATLYLSLDDGMMSPLNSVIGAEVVTRSKRPAPSATCFNDNEGTASIEVKGGYRLELRVNGAEILAAEPDGNPVFTKTSYGKGTVYFVGFPLEMTLTETPGAFQSEELGDCWRIYRMIAEPFMGERVVSCAAPYVGVTEHAMDEGTRVIVIINYSPDSAEVPISFREGWAFDCMLRGDDIKEREEASIGRNDCVIIRAKKRV